MISFDKICVQIKYQSYPKSTKIDLFEQKLFMCQTPIYWSLFKLSYVTN